MAQQKKQGLQAVRAYQQPKTPNYASAPSTPKINDGYDDRQAASMINMAAKHPYETLGYVLGDYIGNYIDRGIQKQDDETARSVANGVLGGYGASPDQNYNIKDMYGGMDKNQAAKDYISMDAANGVNTGMKDASNAGQQAAIAGQQAIQNGAPVTAAGATVMGLDPNSRMAQTLYDSKMDELHTYGPNPSAAKKAEQRIQESLDMLPAMRLATSNREADIENIRQQIFADKNISYTRKQGIFANAVAQYDAARGNQAQQYATELYGKFLTTPTDEFTEKYTPTLMQLMKYHPEVATPIVKEIMTFKNKQADLQKQMALADYNNSLAMARIGYQHSLTGDKNKKQLTYFEQMAKKAQDDYKLYASGGEDYASDAAAAMKNYKYYSDMAKNEPENRSIVMQGDDFFMLDGQVNKDLVKRQAQAMIGSYNGNGSVTDMLREYKAKFADNPEAQAAVQEVIEEHIKRYK